jgi:hypothetical protein
VNLNFALWFELGDAAQVLAQDFLLDFELMLVTGVLIVAASAAAEVGTGWLDAVRGRLYDCRSMGAGEAGLFFGDGCFDFFSGEDKRDEDGLAASAGVGWEAGESVSTVDELFNV